MQREEDNQCTELRVKSLLDTSKNIAILPLCMEGKFKKDSIVKIFHNHKQYAKIYFSDILEDGEIILSKEMGFEEGEIVKVANSDSYLVRDLIVKKIKGEELTFWEMRKIMKAILSSKIDDINVAAFLTAIYVRDMTLEETVNFTKAFISVDNKIDFGNMVLDKHCIGGINGRTSVLLAPIVAHFGYVFPKTSSRAITSAAGTADCVEVVADVDFDIDKLKEIIKKEGAFLVWGGTSAFSPLDSKIISIERNIGINARKKMIASIIAKKASVGATHVILDLVYGKEMKFKTWEDIREFYEIFDYVAKKVGMKVIPYFDEITNPLSYAFGPALEIKEAFEVLENKIDIPLKEKAIKMGTMLLSEVSGTPKEEMEKRIRDALEKGEIKKKLERILRLQNAKYLNSEEIPEAKHKVDVFSKDSGKIKWISIKDCTALAKILGAPYDKFAGVKLEHLVIGDKVENGQKIAEFHSNDPNLIKAAIENMKHYPILELE